MPTPVNPYMKQAAALLAAKLAEDNEAAMQQAEETPSLLQPTDSSLTDFLTGLPPSELGDVQSIPMDPGPDQLMEDYADAGEANSEGSAGPVAGEASPRGESPLRHLSGDRARRQAPDDK